MISKVQLKNAPARTKRVPKTPARQALIVLGMHRSGTSALSGVLVKLGAQPPATLMPPTDDNPRGYWESSALMRFHDEVLQSAGTRWSDWDRFNEEWIDSPVSGQFMDRLATLLQQEYGDARLFLVKDPRICRLLPIWLKVLDELGIVPKVVIPLRHPLEVAHSLAVRDHFTQMRAQLLWVRHNLDAERDSRRVVRSLVRYSDLLSDWRTVVARLSADLDLKWPRRSSTVEKEIETFLSSALRHHSVKDDVRPSSSAIASWAFEVHHALEKLADGGPEAATSRKLDQIRREFDLGTSTFAPVLQEMRAELEEKVENNDQQLADSTRELGSLSERFELLKQENLANYKQAMDYKAALDDLREQYQNRENTHASLNARTEALQQDLARHVEQHQAEVGSLSARHQEEIDRLSAEHRIVLSRLEEQLQASEDARAQALSDCQARTSELTAYAREHELSMAELKSRHRKEMADLADRLHGEINELKAARLSAEESLRERFSEIAALSERVIELETSVEAAQRVERALHDQVARLEASLHDADARLKERAGELRGPLGESEMRQRNLGT